MYAFHTLEQPALQGEDPGKFIEGGWLLCKRQFDAGSTVCLQRGCKAAEKPHQERKFLFSRSFSVDRQEELSWQLHTALLQLSTSMLSFSASCNSVAINCTVFIVNQWCVKNQGCAKNQGCVH